MQKAERHELPESVAIWLCDFDLPDRAKNDAENSEADIPYMDAWLYLLNHASDGTELPNFGISAVEEALGRIRVDNADEELLTAQVKDMVTKEENATILASAKRTGLTPEEIKAL